MSSGFADKNCRDISITDLRTDETVFEAFFKENFTPLTAYCQYKFGFDPDLAKEIVHTAFIKLWEVKDDLTENVPVKVYLQKIITNKALDTLRHRRVIEKSIKLVSDGNEEPGTINNIDIVDFKELLELVHGVIREMPEQMRIVFELSRLEGLKYRDIALKLGISIKTVETQMSRALAKLRQRLSKYLMALLIITVLHL